MAENQGISPGSAPGVPGKTVQKKFKKSVDALWCSCHIGCTHGNNNRNNNKMRTKKLLLVAAISAASLATALAQTNVYSLNVVGYVNATLPPSSLAGGFAILCNPLNNGSNTLAEILPNPPVNTRVYQYVGGSYVVATYEVDDFGDTNWGDYGVNVLAPGEGFWVKNPDNATNVLTFVGEVAQGSTTNLVPAGFGLRGSIVPQALPLWDPNTAAHGTNDLNYPATMNETYIYLYRDGYIPCSYEEDDLGNPSWTTVPVPNVGEGFWTKENSAKPWVRDFSVQ